MKEDYITVAGSATVEFTEKKSVFTGHVRRVESDAAATAFIAEIRKKYSDATHNVYAYLVRKNNIQRYSDDGEPQGTAGMPVLDSIRKRGLCDTAVVVTRYFGGILLGGGGLVRAYGTAASSAIEAAGIAHYTEFTEFTVNCDYSDYQKIQYEINRIGITTDDSSFGEGIALKLAAPTDVYSLFAVHLTEITQGRCTAVITGTRFDIKNT